MMPNANANPPDPTLTDIYQLTMARAANIAQIGIASQADSAVGISGATSYGVTGKPAGSQPFDIRGTTDLANPPVGALQEVCRYAVPLGYNAVCNWYSCNVIGGANFDGTGNIVWQILRGTDLTSAVPVKNFDNITSQVGDLIQPSPLNDLTMTSGETYIFAVKHVADAGLVGKVACRLVGFEYPAKR